MVISLVIDLLSLILQTGLLIVINPLFWVVMLLIYFQTRGLMHQEEKTFQISSRGRREVLKRVFHSSLYGAAGGFLGSLIFVLVGVTLSDIGIGYLWLVAILGLLINMRFLCFSYAGGIVSLSSIIFGWPEVNVASILAIVAVLHFIESILIKTSGADHPLPVTVNHSQGQSAGVYILQRIWPVPFVAMIALAASQAEIPASSLDMPDWWPLIETLVESGPGETVMYILLPIAAGLGYGDMSAVQKPETKAVYTSRSLLLYSLILLVFAVAGSYYFPLLVLGALFSPLGHEAVIKKGQKNEYQKPPIYTDPPEGILVLDVLKGFPAEQAGLERGDVVLAVNDMDIDSHREFFHSLVGHNSVQVEVEDRGKLILENEGSSPGIVFLNQGQKKDFSELTNSKSLLRQFFKFLKKKINEFQV
ncbi:MAG: PDZ domain-containing protein [Halanaerobiaceae bacterium]